tara:strand:- start:7711 stop:8250 length:540 start_codon:yes stop_codon:yes gene_type:complete
MKDQLSWDPALIKKFGCSNHLKLLNQLRIEVKKYPIKRNPNPNIHDKTKPLLNNSNTKLSITDSKITNDNNAELGNYNLNTIYKSNHVTEKKNYNANRDKTSNISETVIISDTSEILTANSNKQDFSFKPKFSNIFNNNFTNKDTNNQINNDSSINQSITDNLTVNQTFKERLDQIDMK